jgi:hypothetical protein
MRAEIPITLDNGGATIVKRLECRRRDRPAGPLGLPSPAHRVTGLTNSVGLEYAAGNIRINAVAPGGTDTEMLASGTEEQRDSWPACGR